MTPPTDTVTPEELKALKADTHIYVDVVEGAQLLCPSPEYAKKVLRLIAHVERVEKNLSLATRFGGAFFEAGFQTRQELKKAQDQRAKAFAKLKELGERFANLSKDMSKTESESGYAAHRTYKICAEAAEASYKEVAGE